MQTDIEDKRIKLISDLVGKGKIFAAVF